MEEKKYSLIQLSMALSSAIDLISKPLNDHHKQVAFIAYCIGHEMGLGDQHKEELVLASVLHDIGGLIYDERVELLEFEDQDHQQHAEIGYQLFKESTHFSRIAKIIRYHHVHWSKIENQTSNEVIPLESNVIHLADRVSISIDKNKSIMLQAKYITKKIDEKCEKTFNPEVVKAFKSIAKKESFWLDLITILNTNLLSTLPIKDTKINIVELEEITNIFARIIDFKSNFTVVHSTGVAAVAERIAIKLNSTSQFCREIKIAGYLHDLGKLAIPNEILEKPGKLTEEEFDLIKSHTYYTYQLLKDVKGLEDINEYASYHHERLDGTGYPFHLNGDQLKLGSRIMAVADVFTAITETRPYRKGMSGEQAREILNRMSKSFALDASIVNVVNRNFSEINQIRVEAQKKALEDRDNFSKFANAVNQ
ncbi:HD domain-containing protein [Serpentinicella sp. ANB-PHB4]|uniref:HD domain-containing phosphohydrolase n=1 Tax=Serpentinicella sp. ANB-PHB4 TaxID=3074076 RepID=UPI00285A331D|nr:HD domain-containing phosphohydrolase [Serpentinicella sp. ANB-PHB4]MDR5659602.1 HD domain-containing protein [Serpentinicella sp. ANB-PHB4]